MWLDWRGGHVVLGNEGSRCPPLAGALVPGLGHSLWGQGHILVAQEHLF